MTPQKKKVIGLIALGTAIVVAAIGYFAFRPKQPSSSGPSNGGNSSGSSGSSAGNTSSSSGAGSAPAQLKAGDKLIAGESVNIYRDKVLSNASRIGYVPNNSTLGLFIVKEGDWIYVSQSPSGSYPSGTPDYFYVYKSAKFTVIPH